MIAMQIDPVRITGRPTGEQDEILTPGAVRFVGRELGADTDSVLGELVEGVVFLALEYADDGPHGVVVSRALEAGRHHGMQDREIACAVYGPEVAPAVGPPLMDRGSDLAAVLKSIAQQRGHRPRRIIALQCAAALVDERFD